jgi:hypothetical protein
VTDNGVIPVESHGEEGGQEANLIPLLGCRG